MPPPAKIAPIAPAKPSIPVPAPLLPPLPRPEIDRIFTAAGADWQCGSHETNKTDADGKFVLDKHDRLIKERVFVRCTVRAANTGRIIHVEDLDGQDQEQCISNAARAIAGNNGVPLVVLSPLEQTQANVAELNARLAKLESPKADGSSTGPGQIVPPPQ